MFFLSGFQLCYSKRDVHQFSHLIVSVVFMYRKPSTAQIPCSTVRSTMLRAPLSLGPSTDAFGRFWLNPIFARFALRAFFECFLVVGRTYRWWVASMSSEVPIRSYGLGVNPAFEVDATLWGLQVYCFWFSVSLPHLFTTLMDLSKCLVTYCWDLVLCVWFLSW